jgi:hypothetical protein
MMINLGFVSEEFAAQTQLLSNDDHQPLVCECTLLEDIKGSDAALKGHDSIVEIFTVIHFITPPNSLSRNSST